MGYIVKHSAKMIIIMGILSIYCSYLLRLIKCLDLKDQRRIES